MPPIQIQVPGPSDRLRQLFGVRGQLSPALDETVSPVALIDRPGVQGTGLRFSATRSVVATAAGQQMRIGLSNLEGSTKTVWVERIEVTEEPAPPAAAAGLSLFIGTIVLSTLVGAGISRDDRARVAPQAEIRTELDGAGLGNNYARHPRGSHVVLTELAWNVLPPDDSGIAVGVFSVNIGDTLRVTYQWRELDEIDVARGVGGL